MLTIPQNQIMDRWDSLPMNIREALTSEPNSDFLWKTCEREHIPNEKIYDIAKQVSYVLFGFLHSGDLSHELQDTLQINKQTADTIATAINGRVFDPIKNDLNKIFAPPSSLEPAPVVLGTNSLGGAIGFETLRANTATPQIPRPMPPKPPTPPAPAPTVMNRGETKKDINIELSPIRQNSSVPTPAPSASALGAFPKAPSQTIGIPAPVASSLPPKPIAPPPMPIKTESPAADQGPKMLQEEAVIKPLRQTSGFSFNIPLPQSLEAKKEAVPMRPAVLELGNIPPKATPTPGMSRFEPPTTNTSTPLSTGRVEPPKPSQWMPSAPISGSSLGRPSSPPPPVAPMGGQTTQTLEATPAKPAVRVVHYSESTTPVPPKAPFAGNLVDQSKFSPSSGGGNRDIQELTASPSFPQASKASMAPVWPLPADMPGGVKPSTPPSPSAPAMSFPPAAPVINRPEVAKPITPQPTQAPPSMMGGAPQQWPTPPQVPPRPATPTPPPGVFPPIPKVQNFSEREELPPPPNR